MASKRWLEIRELAYSIWQQEGYPAGKDLDHWLRAETEIKLLTLYSDFQRVRRSLNHLYPAIRYDDSFFGGRYDPFAMIPVMMAQGHVLTAAHSINRFSDELRSLTAWTKVFEAVTETERIMALYEFTYPIASHCLSMPYSIKQMFIKSICQLAHQTNRFSDSNWNEKALPDKPNFPDAERLAGRYQSWSALRSALAMLDDAAFRTGSDNYRNEANHGFPRRIEIGYTSIIRRDPKAASYDLYGAPPLLVSDLIPLLVPQHRAASQCHDAYIELVREQHTLWPSLPRTEAEDEGRPQS